LKNHTVLHIQLLGIFFLREAPETGIARIGLPVEALAKTGGRGKRRIR